MKLAAEIEAALLQNPADDEATYHKKGRQESRSYVFNSVHQNIVSDDTILQERIEEIKERTGVQEMITDAGYSDEDAEDKCNENGVELIPTDIKGRTLSDDKLSLKDFIFEGDNIVACPSGNIPIKQVKKSKEHTIVYFSKDTCCVCPLSLKCLIRQGKRRNSFSFSQRHAVIAKRLKAITEE